MAQSKGKSTPGCFKERCSFRGMGKIPLSGPVFGLSPTSDPPRVAS